MKIKALLCAKREATTALLPAFSSAKLALGGGAKRLASPSEANAIGEVILTSPVVKKRSFTRAPQLEQPSTRPPRVSVLDRLSSVNLDLREFLNNKRKFCYEELSNTPPSRYEQAGCQLVTVHSVHCRLGPVPTTPPARQSVFNRLSTQAPMKSQKKNKSTKRSRSPLNICQHDRERT